MLLPTHPRKGRNDIESLAFLVKDLVLDKFTTLEAIDFGQWATRHGCRRNKNGLGLRMSNRFGQPRVVRFHLFVLVRTKFVIRQ